jgi:hypothetical protein
MMIPSLWHCDPLSQVAAELSRLNRGIAPQSFPECCAVATLLEWGTRIVPGLETPALSVPSKRLIYLRQAQDCILFAVMLHEISEIITGRDGGEPPFQANDGDCHHDVACRIFDHLRQDH